MTVSEYLRRYRAARYTRMHMPGHKGSLSPYDLTETEYGAVGAIEDAVTDTQNYLARVYGARQARLLSGGSTQGLLSAVGGMRQGRVLVARNAHKSVWSACELFRREPVVVETEDGILTPEGVERALSAAPDAVGLVVVSPDYYGRTSNIVRFREAVGERTLILDAAHGAHFGLRPQLPSAQHENADITVLSAHKTLRSLTQSAFALLSDRAASGFDRAMGLLATTSPSYLLYASVEDGVRHAQATDCAPILREMSKWVGLVKTDDPLRAVIDGAVFGKSGEELARAFAKEGIIVEFADERVAVLIVTPCDSVKSLRKVTRFLSALPRVSAPSAAREMLPAQTRVQPFLYEGATELVDLSDAVGRVAAEEAGFYPPCIPSIVRGEVYGAELVQRMAERKTFGVTDGKVAVRKE